MHKILKNFKNPQHYRFSVLALFVLSLQTFWTDTCTALPVIPPNSVILDDEVDAFFKESFDLLLKAAHKKQTITPKIYLLANHSVNAASGAGGQFIIYSGLFRMCTTIEEFLGVVAHELAHSKGSHMVQAAVGAEKSFWTAAVAFALGGVAALATKDAAPLLAGVTGGQTAYLGSAMRTMQNLEKAADAEAIKTLSKAGLPTKGLLTFLEKLQKIYGSPDVNPYFMDHPLTEDRISAIRHDVEKYRANVWAQKSYFEKMFDRVRAKTLGFTMEPKSVLTLYTGHSFYDHYARAIAYGRMASPQKAVAELEKLSASEQNDPYILELKSQLFMDMGKSDESITILSKAVATKPRAIYLKMTLAHLLIESRKNISLAIQHLSEIVHLHHDNAFAWQLLGKAYFLEGQEGHSLWANSEFDALRGDKKAAIAKLRQARIKGGNDPILLQKISDLERTIKNG